MLLKERLERESENVLLYFSHDGCSVCKALKPKVKELMRVKFPEMTFTYVNTVQQAEDAARFQVFAVPTVLVYFEGKEYFRFSRNIGLLQLEEAITRPYSLLFD